MDKSAFLVAATAAVTEVQIASMGTAVKFKVMTGKARDEFNAAMQTAGGSPSRFAALIVAATVVDDRCCSPAGNAVGTSTHGHRNQRCAHYAKCQCSIARGPE
jgi:hypothetical protein